MARAASSLPVSDNHAVRRNCCPECNHGNAQRRPRQRTILVGIDDEHHLRHTAHFLDTAQLKLFALRVRFRISFGQASGTVAVQRFKSRRRLMEFEIVCQLVSVPPNQREFMKLRAL